MMKRYLTKSRFKLAHECPTKLAYCNRPEYADARAEDEFLQALAKGGFQVGALAQCYFAGGVNVAARDYDTALSETEALLQRDSVIIYEAAFAWDGCFIRADIVVKTGDHLALYEVKAKSFDFTADKFGKSWEPYLLDVAFQTFVVRRARRDLRVTPYLYLVDKSATTTVEGLNQRFLLTSDGVDIRGPVDAEALGAKLLAERNVEQEVAAILDGKQYAVAPGFAGGALDFAGLVEQLSGAYAGDRKLECAVSSHCKKCQFVADPGSALSAAIAAASGTATPGQGPAAQKSGFAECWSKQVPGWTPGRTPAYDVWYFGKKADASIRAGKPFLDQLEERDIPAGSRAERQRLQIRLARGKETVHFDDSIGEAFAQWRYPLHFIDFETARVAIPFHRGRRPYEQLAFQYSHHVAHADGRIEHRGQYLECRRGAFPNFDFVRALKKELEGDDGTVFRYATHENTVLCDVLNQLLVSDEPDRDELVAWIKTLTKPTDSSMVEWKPGPRLMVDQRDLVVKHFLHRDMGGSNSIKSVLPAILRDSEYLQRRYSQPIYGAEIPSLNYPPRPWIRLGPDGRPVDPYRDLGPILPPGYQRNVDFLFLENGDEEIAEGGAAMMAYAFLQFTEMSDDEAEKIRLALLRYCELDTFAMVLLWEYWRDRLAGRPGTAVRA